MLPKEVINNIRQIEIRSGKLVNELFAGQYSSVFKGHGMEFSEVREYMPGDDVRTIDWNVTARYGKPFVKKFIEERELTVILLVDVSGSLKFGTQDRFKEELAAEVSSVLAFSAIKNNDRVGMIIFSDKIEKVIRPKKGRNHILRLIREILYFKPEGRGTDITLALKYLNEIWRRKSVVFLFSDFYDKNCSDALKVASKRHDLTAVRILDDKELSMPSVGIASCRDPETGETIVIDTSDKSFREAYAKKREGDADDVKQMLRKAGIDLIELRTGKPYILPLIEFFKRREKRFAY